MSQYVNEVLERADSPASIFIGVILLICLVVELLSNKSRGDK